MHRWWSCRDVCSRGHRTGTAWLHRQTGLSAVERLDLAFLIDREDDSMGRRIDMEVDDVAQLIDKLQVGGEYELFHPVRFRVAAQEVLLRSVTAPLSQGAVRSPFVWKQRRHNQDEKALAFKAKMRGLRAFERAALPPQPRPTPK
jgi:hypothetical protein